VLLIFTFRYVKKKKEQRFNGKSMHSLEILYFAPLSFWEDFNQCPNFYFVLIMLLGAIKFLGFRFRQYSACSYKLGQFAMLYSCNRVLVQTFFLPSKISSYLYLMICCFQIESLFGISAVIGANSVLESMYHSIYIFYSCVPYFVLNCLR
jgi:hypothetical protein